jgi:curved DNA-binding protein CbpA
MQKNYYQILQVDPSAEPEVISAAYKRLSIKYHPDTNRSANANRRMQDINEAYQILKDPDTRAHYDLYLQGRSSGPHGDGGNGRQRAETTTSPSRESTSTAPPSGPQHALANMIVSLTFPITYVVLVFLLTRFFRSPHIIVILAVIIIAGVIAYKVSKRVEHFFYRRR